MAIPLSSVFSYRPWLLGPSWKMPTPTPINSSKGTRVHRLAYQTKTRRPSKVSVHQLGTTTFEDPWKFSSHFSWPLLLVSANDSGTPVAKIELLPSYSALVLIEEPPEGNDPWDLPELQDNGIKWSGKWVKGTSLSTVFTS